MRLYNFISSAFCVIVVVSNIISTKMIHLPLLHFDIPAGLITYPLTFLLSDFTTEIYGAARSKAMVYNALMMCILGYGIIQLALLLPTQDLDNQRAFHSIFGLNGIIITASLTAYVISQLIDIYSYALIKKWTGLRHLWLRNNGSTLLSQIIDTITVNTIHLYFGLHLGFNEILPIMIFSYLYKAFFSIANTPLFYLSIFLAKKRSRETSA